MAQCASGDCLARAHTELLPQPVGSSVFLYVVVCVLIGLYLLGVCTGFYLQRFVSWVWISLTKALPTRGRELSPWARFVARALHFIHRRRNMSLAFRDLSSYSLRNTEGSKPTTRRKRLATPSPRPRASATGQLTPLREGPVVYS